MLALKTAVDGGAALTFEPAREGVLSWNTFAQRGVLEFRILRANTPASPWLKYAQWNTDGRLSCSPVHADVKVDTDVIRSTLPFDGIEVRAEGVDFRTVAFAAPAHASPSRPYAGAANVLEVPQRSQYVVEEERGWCSAASLCMLNAFFGMEGDVASTARAVFDRAYNGTGNWAFNVAYSGSLGLRAAVAYLRNLDHAQLLIDAGLPIAISYSWRDGELPDAPIEHSDGHLAVLCGFDAQGDCVMNDPAAPAIRTVYPRAAIERIWQRSNGVCYVVAPGGVDFVSIVNS